MSIDHQFLPVTAENKVEKLVELLNAERGLALVFVRAPSGAPTGSRSALKITMLIRDARRQDAGRA